MKSRKRRNPPSVLVIFNSEGSWSRIKGCCQQIHQKMESKTTDFNAVQLPLPAPMQLPPDPYDLVLLWLTKDQECEESLVDWLDCWAQQKSDKASGTLACFVDEPDPGLSLRFWKIFTKSVAIWPGIDFQWHRFNRESSNLEVLNSTARILERYSEAAGETEACDFQIDKICA